MPTPLLTVDTLISASPAAIWSAITGRPSALFAGATVETDWRTGSPITVSGEWNGKPFKDFGAIETAAPPAHLRLSHWTGSPERPDRYDVVDYRLAPEGDGARVTLTQLQMGPGPAPDPAQVDQFRQNWTMMLGALKRTVEGR